MNKYYFTASDLTDDVKAGISDKSRRKNYKNEHHIIGWYQGEGDSYEFTPVSVNKPKLTVTNGDVLSASADITDDIEMKVLLCIRGITSGAEYTKTLVLTNNKATEILDDITDKDLHFKNKIKPEKDTDPQFLPGEDIEIFLTAQAKEKASNVAESDHIITNSLFSSISPSEITAGNYTAKITNFRHLENLCQAISGVNTTVNEKKITFDSAEQAANLSEPEAGSDDEDRSWEAFIGNTDVLKSTSVVSLDGSVSSAAGKYLPVNITETNDLVKYDGKNLKIEGIDVSAATDAGMFGTISKAFEIDNLELCNFNVSTTNGNSGAMVGSSTMNALTVNNVIAYNPVRYTAGGTDKALAVKSTAGASGGLVGSMTSGSLTNCAAAVYVEGSTSAGGLVGFIASGTVTGSYSGGHTSGGEYLDLTETEEKDGRINVKATGENGNAGGIVGSGSGTLTNCYSSSSVSGKNVHPMGKDIAAPENMEPDKDLNYVPYYVCKDNNGNYEIGTVYQNGIKYEPYFEYSDLTGNGILNIVNTPSTADHKNYDSFWDEDVYPCRTIDMYYTDGTELSWFLKTHVGDWAYPDYTANLINEN